MSEYDWLDTIESTTNNTFLKITTGSLAAWVLFVMVNRAKRNDQTPERRKHRQALTAGKVDIQIDSRNRVSGKRAKVNPDIPFYSRHNYNRRRRPTQLC